jgi:hypothetical protein
VLQDNGGLRPEYDKHFQSPHKIFHDSLRNERKSPLRYFKDSYSYKADITSYINWGSTQGKIVNARHAKMQKDLVTRLTTPQ